MIVSMDLPDVHHWLGALNHGAAPYLALSTLLPGSLSGSAGVGEQTSQSHYLSNGWSDSRKLLEPPLSDMMIRNQPIELEVYSDSPILSPVGAPPLSALYAAVAAGGAYTTAAVLPPTASAELLAPSPPIKRQRVMTTHLAPAAGTPSRTGMSSRPPTTVPAKKPSGVLCFSRLAPANQADILICGNCRDMFHSLPELLKHKTKYCKLRFTCKCSSGTSQNNAELIPTADVVLTCGSCSQHFTDALALMQHFQKKHAVSIFHQQQQESMDCPMQQNSGQTSPEENLSVNGDL